MKKKCNKACQVLPSNKQYQLLAKMTENVSIAWEVFDNSLIVLYNFKAFS